MIPVFCFLYLTAETKQDIWKAAAVVLISILTDTLDVLLIKEGYMAVMGLILLMMTVMAVTLVLYIPVFENHNYVWGVSRNNQNSLPSFLPHSLLVT